ncbi:hydrogenase nickel incorporation protein HypA [Thermosphaera chiliense]|uniref:Hydrogenase nickel incorporation protein HypA n=1 Tax=Thermosphaera chiliense TaxID=3402707 RepID=A0A7M1UTK3_9CREN|nr:hydrogenase nickel incorporation protein HypA [Thermosphaera aggregans]QOR94164.1 hydrogenase nickel incorporation protein HypA [Thermosphaera aggregans]
MVHEWALAESIVLFLENSGFRKVKSLRIGLGILQSIDKEIFSFSLQELLRDKGLTVENLEIVDENAELECNTCGYRWSLSPESMDEAVRESIHFVPESIHAFTKCPKCGSRDFSITQGRGVRIIEVQPDEL